MPTYTTSDLAGRVGGLVEGDPGRVIEDVAPLESAGPLDLSFFAREALRDRVEASRAGAILVAFDAALESSSAVIVRVADPQEAFADLLPLFRPLERAASGVHHSAVIGRGGKGIDEISHELNHAVRKNDSCAQVQVNVAEVRQPELDAQLVAENVATQLERRVSFRRAMKKSVQTAMKFGAKGIRLNASGRLGGAEMSRREWYREGRVPLHTLRADIDYGFAVSNTTYGVIGIQVWIYKGDKLTKTRATTAR